MNNISRKIAIEKKKYNAKYKKKKNKNHKYKVTRNCIRRCMIQLNKIKMLYHPKSQCA